MTFTMLVSGLIPNDGSGEQSYKTKVLYWLKPSLLSTIDIDVGVDEN